MQVYIRFNRSITVANNQNKTFRGNGNIALLENAGGVYDLNLNTDSFIDIGGAPSAGSIVHWISTNPMKGIFIEGQPPVLTEV